MTQGLGLHRSARIEVAASVDAVWGVLTDLPGWPTWMPGVKAVEADGPLGPGTRFRWRTTSGVIRSEVLEVQPGHSVVWRGRTLGIEALHSWRLEDLGGASRPHARRAQVGVRATCGHCLVILPWSTTAAAAQASQQ